MNQDNENAFSEKGRNAWNICSRVPGQTRLRSITSGPKRIYPTLDVQTCEKLGEHEFAEGFPDAIRVI